jgi:non-ribosomal peptide synthetase component F
MSGQLEYLKTLPPEQQAIRAKYIRSTGPCSEFTKEEIEQCITDRFEQQVRRYPDRLAVKTQHHELSYEALNRAANRAAHAILQQWGTGPEPVALLVDKDAPLLAAILGVLKVGKIYVPLDPVNPRARVSYMLEDSQARLILTTSRYLALCEEVAPHGCQLLNIDAFDDHLPVDNLELRISPDTLAYILYTSGSTGQPKGIVQNHRNILHSIMRHIHLLPVSIDDRVTLLSSMSFVGAVRDTFSALLNGAALFPFDLKEESGEELAKWMIREEITVYTVRQQPSSAICCTP